MTCLLAVWLKENVMLLAPSPGVDELAKWLLLEVFVRDLWSRPA